MVRLEGIRSRNRAGRVWEADPRAREVFERLSPEGLTARYRWLFASPWVEFGSDELEGYDAIALGTGTRYGRLSAQMASFLLGDKFSCQTCSSIFE